MHSSMPPARHGQFPHQQIQQDNLQDPNLQDHRKLATSLRQLAGHNQPGSRSTKQAASITKHIILLHGRCSPQHQPRGPSPLHRLPTQSIGRNRMPKPHQSPATPTNRHQ
ncbi:hypothetical protein Nepgr_031371 [Nepenthes gracilis]|uniref:Uncharacterized protein n=1 Tax=Nepenthes gracilis TaxID=150966 RepID=A0AAD3TIB1_NEPGR|nr:hypothetical protein Nepgr_031371 [Nepenthes gracilis]